MKINSVSRQSFGINPSNLVRACMKDAALSGKDIQPMIKAMKDVSRNIVICPTSIYVPYFLKQKYMVGLQDISDEDWKTVIDTNLYSVFFFLQEVVPNMIHNKSGCIINISSIYANIYI